MATTIGVAKKDGELPALAEIQTIDSKEVKESDGAEGEE